ncbi:MAG TPA: heme exporter protein CcmB [Thermoanaerobaculia bacterium]|nr:heme exporter protein CcmB [Thermoanaerobaculia bacterium]
MSRPASTWAREAAAVFAKEWRSELRTRYALNTLALFAINTLVVVSASLGPLGAAPGRATETLPVLLWLILLFAAAAGLPRAFVHEEETQTATALRLAATPSALFCGKLAYSASVLAALEALVAPLFLAVMNLDVPRPGLLVATLAAGGFGLAAGSTLVAAIIAQARGQGTLFAVLSFPVLLPLLLLAVELTRAAFAGGVPGGPEGPVSQGGAGVAMVQLLLYDGAVTTAGLMLFPVVWNP